MENKFYKVFNIYILSEKGYNLFNYSNNTLSLGAIINSVACQEWSTRESTNHLLICGF